MMRRCLFNIFTYIVLYIGLLITPQISYCQQLVFAEHDDSTSFNAIEHLIISRYKNPDKHTFEKNSVFNHWTAGVYTDQPLAFIAPNRNSYAAEMNSHWGVFAGKQFDPHNALRIQYDFGKIHFSGTPSALAKRHQIGIDYLWDMSNYFYGYNEARPWSLSYLVGVNIGKTSEAGSSSIFGGVHTGTQLRGNLSPRTFIFIEPHLTVYMGDMNTFRDPTDWHKIRFASNTLVGAAARLSNPYRVLQWNHNIPSDSISLLDNYFIQLSHGGYSQLTGLQGSITVWEPSFQGAIGHWINPKLAIRTSFYAGKLNHPQQNNSVGIITEGVLNIPETFNFSLGRFGIEASLGLRYDFMAHDNISEGTSSALQLKYFANQQFALFAEGRYSSMHDNEAGYYETFTNLNLGVELYRTNFDRYNAKQMTMGNVPYRTQYFASLGYGQMYPLLLSGNWASTLSSTYDWAIGYRFDALNAIRVKGGFIEFQPQSTQPRYRWATLSPQYMLNITNWWMGNTTHSFDMRPYIGPVFSLTKTENFGHGIEAGIPIAWKLLPSLELFVEPSYRYTFSPPLHRNGYNKGMLGMSGGISYIQGPIYFSEYFKRFNWRNDWFVACFEGLQQDLSSVGYEGITTLPVENLAIGQWLGPIGLRLSGFGSLNRKLDSRKYYPMLMAYAGYRAEGMVNLISLFAPSKELKDFEVDLLAGYHGSLMYRPLKTYTRNWAYTNGSTAALQFKYYVMDGIGLFIEPRYTKVGYNRTQRKEYGGKIIKMSQEFTDISIGMEVRKHSVTRNGLRKSYADFRPRTFVSGNLELCFPFHYNSSKSAKDFFKHMSPQTTFNVGREFNAINSLRGAISFVNLRSLHSEAYENGYSVSADYMLDLTNGMLGYDPTRIIDVKAIVGFNTLYSSYQKKTNIGFHGGAQVGLYVTNNVDIYVEGKVSAYYKPSIISGMRTVRHIGIMPIASIGTTYYFNMTTHDYSLKNKTDRLKYMIIKVLH